ncbi:MAG: hypothetical protein KDH09_11800 [Chrysiogenetes bacterium]|nr:hypothetical protein [Chrysiogenetes bacterium]
MKKLYWLWWAAFALAAFLTSPAPTGESLKLFGNLAIGNYWDFNPALIAEWNAIGVLWLAFGATIWHERETGLPHGGWFLLGAFFFGAMALLPYYALRRDDYVLEAPQTQVARVLDHPALGWFLALAGAGLLGLGIFVGDWPAFVDLARRESFVYVMSIDICLLTLLLPLAAVRADMRRRGCWNAGRFAAYAAIPVVGPMFYLARRPPLA